MDNTRKPNTCPDCELDAGLNFQNVDRRKFLKATGSVAVVSAALPATLLSAASQAVEDPQATPETLVKRLYDSMNEKQRAGVCFDWDQLKTFKSGINKEGLLRTRVENNWQVTDKKINSKFYTADQRLLSGSCWGSAVNRYGFDQVGLSRFCWFGPGVWQ